MAPLPNDQQQYSASSGSSGSFKMTNNADNTSNTTIHNSFADVAVDRSKTNAAVVGSHNTATATPTTNNTPNTNTGLYLRWSRIIKTVTIKADNSGLLRGSIAAPTKESNESFIRRSNKNSNSKKEEKKNILKEVSGYAAPGEIVAMMG